MICSSRDDRCLTRSLTTSGMVARSSCVTSSRSGNMTTLTSSSYWSCSTSKPPSIPGSFRKKAWFSHKANLGRGPLLIWVCAESCSYLLPTWLAFSLGGVQTQNYCHLPTRRMKENVREYLVTFSKMVHLPPAYLRLANAGDMQVGPLTSPKTVLLYKLASKAQKGVHANVKASFRLLLTRPQPHSTVKQQWEVASEGSYSPWWCIEKFN